MAKTKTRTKLYRARTGELTTRDLLSESKRAAKWVKHLEQDLADQLVRAAYHRLVAREHTGRVSEIRTRLRGAKRIADSAAARAKKAKA